MSSKSKNILRLIELEQAIISGVKDTGEEINDKFLKKEMPKLLRKLGRKEDVLRLLGIYFSCYSVPKTEFNQILQASVF